MRRGPVASTGPQRAELGVSVPPFDYLVRHQLPSGNCRAQDAHDDHRESPDRHGRCLRAVTGRHGCRDGCGVGNRCCSCHACAHGCRCGGRDRCCRRGSHGGRCRSDDLDRSNDLRRRPRRQPGRQLSSGTGRDAGRSKGIRLGGGGGHVSVELRSVARDAVPRDHDGSRSQAELSRSALTPELRRRLASDLQRVLLGEHHADRHCGRGPHRGRIERTLPGGRAGVAVSGCWLDAHGAFNGSPPAREHRVLRGIADPCPAARGRHVARCRPMHLIHVAAVRVNAVLTGDLVVALVAGVLDVRGGWLRCRSLRQPSIRGAVQT